MSAASNLESRLAADAGSALRLGRFAEALPLAERLARLPDPPAGTATLRAEALFGLERLAEAEGAADAAVCAADAGASRLLRARIRLARGDASGAADDAAAAVMAAPHDRAAQGLLGSCLLDLGRFDEALFFLGKVAQDSDPPSLLLLAQAFARTDRPEVAAELLDHCGRHWPDLPGLPGIRAQAALLAKQPGEAETIVRDALLRDGPSPALLTLLGHALVGQGRLTEGGVALAAASRLAPQDGYLAHLAAASAGDAPDAAGAEYVSRLFDGYAAHFEASLVSLGYRVPGLLLRAVERLLPGVASGTARLGPVLDLGCGTGLVGVVLDDLLPRHGARCLVGIDLSRRMLEQAAQKRLYTELRHAEVGAALAADGARYDLIAAADVFCYLGRLDALLQACANRLAPDGLILFSLENDATTAGWRLGPTGRFAHAPDYIRRSLADARLEVVLWQEEALRLEGNAPVAGLLIGARLGQAH